MTDLTALNRLVNAARGKPKGRGTVTVEVGTLAALVAVVEAATALSEVLWGLKPSHAKIDALRDALAALAALDEVRR